MWLDFWQNFPPEIATMLMSILPITEIRVSIPVALEVYELSVPSAIFWSLVGNVATALALILIIGPLTAYLGQKSVWLDRIFKWIFERTRRKFYNKYVKYGDAALILFVAVPLPGTGAWTGTLAAWLFGVKTVKAFVLISIGVFISAVIVTLITLGVVKFI